MSQLQNSSGATEAVSVSFQNSLVNGSAVNHLHRLRAFRWDRLCVIYYSASCSGLIILFHLHLCLDIPSLKWFLVLDRLKVTVQLKGLLNIPTLSQWYNQRGQMEPGPSTAATHQYLPIFVMVSSQPNSQQEVSSVHFEFGSTCACRRRSCCFLFCFSIWMKICQSCSWFSGFQFSSG